MINTECIYSEHELEEFITLTNGEREGRRQCPKKMPVKITRHYARLLDPVYHDDPLRRIVIPSTKELITYPDDDVIDDHKDEALYQPVEGIIHRYPGKVLVKVKCTTQELFLIQNVFYTRGRPNKQKTKYGKQN